MILGYLYSLGFSVIFTANTADYCLRPLNGCYLPETKQIVVSVNSPHFKYTFWHEVGHALWGEDAELLALAAKDEDLKGFKNAEELVADYYVRYHNNPAGFKKRWPEAYKRFITKTY